MHSPLPDKPGMTELPVEQGDDFMFDSPRFPAAQEKTRMRPAAPMTRYAAVRRNVA